MTVLRWWWLGAVVLLIADIAEAQGRNPQRRAMDDRGLQVGESVPDFRLKTVEGTPIDLKTVLRDGPVVLETGSYTCPVFRSKVRAMEKLYQKFKGRAGFFVVYTPEAHPKDTVSYFSRRKMDSHLGKEKDLGQAKKYEQRVAAAKGCVKDLDIGIPVLVDEMNNAVTDLLGPAPNTAYLIDRDGKIVSRYGWLDVDSLRRDLEKLVGP